MKRVLFIGAGGGVGPRAFHARDPQMGIEVVDIDGKVLELAQSHFYLERAPTIKTIAADGRAYARSAPRGAYDCIVLDAFSIGGRIPFHLVSREFIALCRDRLAPGGVFLMNINSAIKGDRARIFQSMYKTVESVFPENAHAFVLGRAYVPAAESTNVILVGIDRDERVTPQQWAEWAEAAASNPLVARDAEAMVDDLVRTIPDAAVAPVFTDDFAPIETMSF